MNKFLKEFKDRGYFYQCTNDMELSKLLDKNKMPTRRCSIGTLYKLLPAR